MDNKEKITTDVYFRGIAGRLEGKYTQNKDATAPSVLLLPPDPRYGGTLDNAVIVAIEKVFRECGFKTLRLNYRGIHRSDGVFNGPEDAIYDAATALDWLQEQNPESSHFWLVGYSFGIIPRLLSLQAGYFLQIERQSKRNYRLTMKNI